MTPPVLSFITLLLFETDADAVDALRSNETSPEDRAFWMQRRADVVSAMGDLMIVNAVLEREKNIAPTL